MFKDPSVESSIGGYDIMAHANYPVVLSTWEFNATNYEAATVNNTAYEI